MAVIVILSVARFVVRELPAGASRPDLKKDLAAQIAMPVKSANAIRDARFDFGFDLAALLVVFDLFGDAGAPVFEFDFGPQVPAFAQVVVEGEHGARQRYFGAIIARRTSGIRIAVRPESHILEKDFTVSPDTVFREIPFERDFPGGRIGLAILCNGSRGRNAQDQASNRG